MTRRRLEAEPYTPPLPKSRNLQAEAERSIALQLYAVAAQAEAIANVIRAAGLEGAARELHASVKCLKFEAAQVGRWNPQLPPKDATAHDEYWRERARQALAVVW